MVCRPKRYVGVCCFSRYAIACSYNVDVFFRLVTLWCATLKISLICLGERYNPTIWSYAPFLIIACKKGKFILILRLQTVSQKPRSGVMWAVCSEHNKHNKKRLSALILDFPEFSQNSFRCQGLSNGRCPWICNILLSAGYFERNIAGCFDCIYRRGLLRVAVRHLKGNARSLGK